MQSRQVTHKGPREDKDRAVDEGAAAEAHPARARCDLAGVGEHERESRGGSDERRREERSKVLVGSARRPVELARSQSRDAGGSGKKRRGPHEL
jgi:ribonuclease PH